MSSTNPQSDASHDAHVEEAAPPTETTTGTEVESAQDETSDEVSRLATELEAANGRVLRAQAELENFRKRIRREMDDERKFAAMPLVRDLLPVIDDLDRAISASEQGADSTGLLDGVKMVRSKLLGALAQHGCQPVPAKGAAFDPAIHEAIMKQPTSAEDAGTVVDVAQEGYRMHDRVVRPAQVVVATEVESQAAGE